MGKLGSRRITPPVRIIPCHSLLLMAPSTAKPPNSTLIVLFLIDILFDFSSLLHPYKCDGSELLGKALPCGRDLWHASSRAEWEREYTRQGVGKQLTYGDLVNNRLRTDGALDSWLEQLDDFGTLVMAAASLKD